MPGQNKRTRRPEATRLRQGFGRQATKDTGRRRRSTVSSASQDALLAAPSSSYFRQRLLFAASFILATCLFAGSAAAGVTNSPAPPDDPSSAVWTLEDIYQRLTTGQKAEKRETGFARPDAGPGTTMRTLNEIMQTGILPYSTGQTSSYGGGSTGKVGYGDIKDAGYYRKGLSWPVPRFTDNGDGTVTDHLTELIWLKKADAFGDSPYFWTAAMTYCHELEDGMHGLTDGSQPGDWRMPNLNELRSLITYEFANPAITDPTGTNQWSEAAGPFTGILLSDSYFSSTRYAQYANSVWYVSLANGYVARARRDSHEPGFVLPVRGGGL